MSQYNIMKRSDAIDKCISMGKDFIHAFHYIYTYPHAESIAQWIAEMQNWWNIVRSIKLDDTRTILTNQQIYDWFLMTGECIEDLLHDAKEILCYDNFVIYLLRTKNLQRAIDKYISR